MTLPHPAVLDLHVTVVGASAGNGVYGIGAFSGVVWDAGALPLNLGVQLVGQPTAGTPWGTLDCEGADFNLLANSGAAPGGLDCFVLAANQGNADAMILESMFSIPTPTALPTLSQWSLLALAGVLGAGALVALRRRG